MFKCAYLLFPELLHLVIMHIMHIYMHFKNCQNTSEHDFAITSEEDAVVSGQIYYAARWAFWTLGTGTLVLILWMAF